MTSVAETSQQIIAQGSKSFSAAAKLFGREMRDSASMLYAWCRHCDDVIDGQELGFSTGVPLAKTPEERLATLYSQTKAAIAGRPGEDPVFQALHQVVSKHAIPERYPLELLEGFGMDVEERRYETLEDVLLYCYHVAGVVGVMMAMIMGVREAETLKRAADLGIAFQLTNISRDVADDAAMGRVYLPESWLREAGVAPGRVGRSEHWPAVAGVVGRLLDEAEPYYDSARIGLRALPFRAAWAIAAARGVYRDIGTTVRARGADAWRRRASTGKGRKMFWMVWGGLTAAKAGSIERVYGLPERPDLWMKPGLGS